MENKQIKGAVGPLLGVLGESPVHGDHPPDEVSAGKPTSAETGCLEEYGRAAKKSEAEKRKQKILESVAQHPEEGERNLPRKALEATGKKRETANRTESRI